MKTLKYYLILSFIFFGMHLKVCAQIRDNSDLIQFSGVIVSGDSLKHLPFSAVIIKNTHRGTISDYYGFFSIVAKKSDTIEFSSMGYKKAMYVIPDTLMDTKYSLIQMLTTDTIQLPETVVHPWPTQEQFREAFINLRVPDDDMDRAKKNLARAEQKENWQNTAMDGSMNYKSYMNQKQSQLYYIGQYQPNNLLNPIAWAQFIEAWQRGDFKKKK